MSSKHNFGKLSSSKANAPDSAKRRSYQRRPLDKAKIMEDIMSNANRDKLRIFVASWNMGNAEAEGMEYLFREENRVNDYDVFVIGLQESTYSLKGKKDKIKMPAGGERSNSSVLSDASNGTSATPASNQATAAGKGPSRCIEHLSSQIAEFFGSKFYCVQHCYRAQLQLFVYARESYRPRISNVQQSIENTGFLHVFPNKGGLLVTMQIDGTKLAFVSCHLAAHEGVNFCEERNASIVEILGGVRAGDKRLDITEQFHHVFWMGDMNYRITFDTTQPSNTKKNIKRFEDNSLALEKTVSMSDNPLGAHSSKNMDRHAESVLLGIENFSDSDSDEASDADDIPADNNNNNNNRSFYGSGYGFFGGGGGGRGQQSPKNTSGGGSDGLAPQSPKGVKVMAGKGTGAKKAKNVERRKIMKKVHDLICDENWSELLKYDELNREMAAGRVLNDFTALQPAFPPTFKRARKIRIHYSHSLEKDSFINHPHEYDLQREGEEGQDLERLVTRYYNNKRIPSYTDRILFKSMPAFKTSIKTLFFESSEKVTSSDHKPVRAGFEIALSKGEHGIFVDKQLLKWVGRISNTTSAQRNDVHILKLTISDLKGENLEEMDSQMFGGGSDPYIIITCDPASMMLYKGTFKADHDGIKSSVIKHNLNPVWTDQLELLLASVDLKGLARNGSLIFSVWDEDRLNADDIIGVFTVPLRDIITAFAESRAYVFDEQLRLNSEVMGSLSGRITIDGDFSEVAFGYIDLESDRLATERYVSLHEAQELHMHPQGCGCTLS